MLARELSGPILIVNFSLSVCDIRSPWKFAFLKLFLKKYFAFFLCRRRWRPRRNLVRSRPIRINALARKNSRRELGLGPQNQLPRRLPRSVRPHRHWQRANRSSPSEHHLRRLQKGWNRWNPLPLCRMCQLWPLCALLRQRRSQSRALVRALSNGKFGRVSFSLPCDKWRSLFVNIFFLSPASTFHHVPDPFASSWREFLWTRKSSVDRKKRFLILFWIFTEGIMPLKLINCLNSTKKWKKNR